MLTGYLPYESLATTRTNLLLKMTNTFTNQVSGGQASLASAYRPTTVSDYMLFDGSRTLRFSENNDAWRVTSPYSVEFDVYLEEGDNKWIATHGEGFGAGWPEWSVIQQNGGIYLSSSADNNGNQFSLPLTLAYRTKQWYRVGFMFYTVGSQYKVRGYLNGSQVFDQNCLQPYNTPNGLAFGSDWTFNGPTSPAGAIARVFNGRIRNVLLGRSLFWPA